MERLDSPESLEIGLIPLSPSRAADFKACPQLFKFRAIDRLPEPSDPSRARGTLVHAVLERLCRLPAAHWMLLLRQYASHCSGVGTKICAPSTANSQSSRSARSFSV